MVDMSKRDEVRTIISSLLVSQKHAIPTAILDREYYKEEGEHIPWRTLGYSHLVEFLRSYPQYFKIEERNETFYIKGIPSEKSGHVSSLVARQKESKPATFRHRPSNYTPHMQRQKLRISAEVLNNLVQYINDNPRGISIQMALQLVQERVPHVIITANDLCNQLYELSHQVCINGEIIRPIRTKRNYDGKKVTNFQPPISKPYNVQPSQIIYDVAGNESDNPCAMANSSNYSRTNNEFQSNFTQNMTANRKELLNYENDDNEYGAVGGDKAYVQTEDLSSLINQRLKSRIEQLVQKEPNGIWCAQLPNIFLQEYKVPLNYMDLGFNSVREFVSHMPDICYVEQKSPHSDFIIYSVDKSSKKSTSRTTETDETKNELYDQNDINLPVPLVLPSSLCKKFVPDDSVNYDECIDQIFVSDLANNGKHFIEVYVVEVFTPSFFWVHLRQNRERFETLMVDLHTFYKEKSNSYSIPPVNLKKGLNCACKYNNVWHRAIIKTVRPDMKVTVLFYDYGTLKTYPPEEIFFLHKDFAYLPAQAIPCGLYKVKPCDGEKWKKTTCDQFLERISGLPLAAKIVSIDVSNNSMLVTLIDTIEEDDVDINRWLVTEGLATTGEMVRTHTNFSMLHYKNCKGIVPKSSTLVKKRATENIGNINKVKYDENRSISCNTEAHGLSEKNRMVEKNMQQIMSSSDADSSKNISVEKRSEGPRELVVLLEKLKELVTKPSTKDISCLKVDRDLENSAKQTSFDTEEVSDKSSEYDPARKFINMKFSSINPDDEESNKKYYFGTFRSLHGGNGLMEPFDWSKIKETDSLHSNTSSNNMLHENLNRDRECESNEIEDKLKSQNQENKPAPRQCFLNAVYNSIKNNEDEYWLPCGNIDYDDRDMSQSLAKLRTRIEMDNDKYTIVIVQKKTLEALHEGRQSRYMSKCNMDNITVTESDDADSSTYLAPEKVFNKDNENTNDITEICVNQKIDRNVNNELKLVSLSDNDNKQNKVKYISECNVDNAESIIDTKCIQHTNRNSINTKESFINEPIQSFPNNILPNGTEDVMPSSDDQQDIMTTYLNELYNSSKPALTLEPSNSNKSNNNSESKINLSPENSIISSTASEKDTRKCFDISIQVPKISEQLSKVQNMTNNVELHSANSSSSESNHENKTSVESNCTSVMCNSYDENKSETPIPVVNDYDIDSDESEWDCNIAPAHLSAFMSQFGPQITKLLEDKSKKL